MIVYISRGEIMARAPEEKAQRISYYNVVYKLPLVPEGYLGDLTDYGRKDPLYRCDDLIDEIRNKVMLAKTNRTRVAAENMLRVVRQICAEKRKESA